MSAGSAAAAWVVNGNLQTDVVGGGTFDLGSLSGNGVISGHANNASTAVSTLRVGGRNTDSTFNGRIVNNAANDPLTGNLDDGRNNVLALTKLGAGTLTLGGNNSYSGATTIQGGTLRLANQPVSALAVANYTFDSVAGTTVNNTGSGGTAMNGTLTNGATIVSGGQSGNALSLANGANVTVANAIADLSNNTTWTVSAWVKTATAGSTILSKSDGGWGNGNTVFYLGDGSGGGSGGTPSGVRWAGGFLQTTSTSTPANDDAWHLVTYVNNAGTYSIYTDGVRQTLSPGNVGFSNADIGGTVRIGSTTDGGDGDVNFKGLLDNVQVYNLALSAQQIASLITPGTAIGSLPTTTAVSISSGATLDVNGVIQQIATLNAPAGAAVLLGNGQLIVTGAGASNYAGSITGAGGSIVKQGAGTLTLGGANTYTGGTIVTAGSLVVGASNALGSSPVAITGGTLALQGALAAPVVVPALSVSSGGKVDLNGSGLVIDYAADDTTSAGKAVADIVASRITSATLSGNANLAIGYASGGELGGTFQGMTLDDSSIALLATFKGDTNLDKVVNFTDLLALAKHYGVATGATWAQGDNNYDGAVNFTDLLALAKNYGQALPTSAPNASAAFTSDWALAQALAPEPATLMVALGATAAFGRRRRSR